MTILSVYSNPITWLESSYPIKIGQEALDFILTNGSQSLASNVKQAFQNAWSEYVIEHPQYKNNDDLRFQVTIQQPILAPKGPIYTDEYKHEPHEMILACCVFIGLMKPDDSLDCVLVLSLVLDPETRRFIGYMPTSQVTGKPAYIRSH